MGAVIISMNSLHPFISVSMARPTIQSPPPPVPQRPGTDKLEQLKKLRIEHERRLNQEVSIQDEVKQAGIDSVRVVEGLNNVDKVLQSHRNSCFADPSGKSNIDAIPERSSVQDQPETIDLTEFKGHTAELLAKLKSYLLESELNPNIKLPNEKVTSLKLSNQKIKPETLKFILLNFPNLKSLDLSSARLDGNPLAVLSQFSKLETLNLSRTDLKAKDLQHLKGLTDLKNLYLGKVDLPEKESTFDFLLDLKNLQNVTVWSKNKFSFTGDSESLLDSFNKWVLKTASGNFPASPFAQAYLGLNQLKGTNGYGVHPKAALKLLNSADKQGSQAGKLGLAMLKMRDLEGISKDEKGAVKTYLSLAKEGHVGGMVELAKAYQNGQGGLDRNLNEAASLFKRAVDEGGSPEAMAHLGKMIEEGQGGFEKSQKNDKQAFQYYQRAHDQGDPTALRHLAQSYQKGLGVKKDLSKAVDYYDQAIQQGDGEAGLQAALIVEQNELNEDLSKQALHRVRDSLTWVTGHGTIMEIKLNNVEGYYKSAIAKGNSNAAAHFAYFQEVRSQSLQGIYFRPGYKHYETEQIIANYNKGLEGGSPFAYARMAYIHANGLYGPVDNEKARKAAEFAASHNDPSGKAVLGWMYLRSGLARDVEKGKQLVNEAKASNDFYAKQMLKDLQIK